MDSSLFYGGQQAHHLVSDLLGGNRGPEPVILRENLFIVSSNEDGSRRYTTKSLFDITLLFVAEHIHRVDSLVDFPDPIGAKLFSVAHKINIFSIRDLAPKGLQLFVDAYGEMVLKSLCLRNRAHLLVERTAEVKSFLSLTSLDLYGCQLGDEHEIFQHLTSPLLASLAQLFMGNNDISDAGLQRLTAPVRIMHRGLASLQLLDISGNPISRKGLRYLTCLPKLVTLDVSGTNMKLSTGLKTTVWELLGLIYSEKPLDVFDHSRSYISGGP
ncbi:leucine-rich repeat-containing protein 42 isoform X2 [Gouania willdenowi]|uniref:leucine-rich repeat-containing protein 42 isoform X2 n=1 Tax=Gouania willdenowi TaxID=441366 RepID=UPI00105458BA|nr:leucine-rich repeat-containing protein 42 isoform X2 [Gouania willdenowi]